MININKLDDKYLVIKTDDLKEFFSEYFNGAFPNDKEESVIDNVPFKTVLEGIKNNRKSIGKAEQDYVVLNLNDDINLGVLSSAIESHKEKSKKVSIPIKDIAVDLVNSIVMVRKVYK